jgi:hypothetical protein
VAAATSYLRILVVEDQEDLRRILRDLLALYHAAPL